MSKHTPGPWLRAECLIYSLMQDGWIKGEPLMVNRVTISTHFHKEVSDEEREATRNLIAAAPDLLEALQRIASIEDRAYGGDWDEIECARQIARAAIINATGPS